MIPTESCNECWQSHMDVSRPLRQTFDRTGFMEGEIVRITALLTAAQDKIASLSVENKLLGRELFLLRPDDTDRYLL